MSAWNDVITFLVQLLSLSLQNDISFYIFRLNQSLIGSNNFSRKTVKSFKWKNIFYSLKFGWRGKGEGKATPPDGFS